jgi:hypothetical protein
VRERERENMVRGPFYDKNGLKKGAWTSEEDYKLTCFIQRYGHSNWCKLPRLAGILFLSMDESWFLFFHYLKFT